MDEGKDVLYGKKVTILKGKEEIKFDLEGSERRSILLNNFQIESILGNRFLVVYNEDNPNFKVIELEKFELIETSSAKNLIRKVHSLKNSVKICGFDER